MLCRTTPPSACRQPDSPGSPPHRRRSKPGRSRTGRHWLAIAMPVGAENCVPRTTPPTALPLTGFTRITPPFHHSNSRRPRARRHRPRSRCQGGTELAPGRYHRLPAVDGIHSDHPTMAAAALASATITSPLAAIAMPLSVLKKPPDDTTSCWPLPGFTRITPPLPPQQEGSTTSGSRVAPIAIPAGETRRPQPRPPSGDRRPGSPA